MYTVTINGETYTTTSDKEMAEEIKQMLEVYGNDLIEIKES